MSKLHFIKGELNNKYMDWPPKELPPYLLGQIGKRISTVSFLMIILWSIFFCLNHFYKPYTISRQVISVRYAISITFIIISFFIYFVSKSSKMSPKHLIDIGLMYHILVSLGIALSEALIVHPENYIPRINPSWVCIWIVLYPLVVPCTPGKALFAAFLSASMAPLSLEIIVLWGNPLPPIEAFCDVVISHFTAAVFVYIPVRIIHSLSYEIIKAKQLGSYKLVRKIGEGARGEIWEASHKLLKRRAAIKLIKPEIVENDKTKDYSLLIKRFEREAQATASLHSPHSIVLYDYGASASGNLFYVMELLNGYDLNHVVEEWGALQPERVVHIIMQVCDSIADAHYSHIIHRDIKPKNIFLCKNGYKYDFVKVLDFGMVKYSQKADWTKTNISGPDVIIGSPSYIAPEMITGETIDHRFDIYSIGCVLYWLLTGRYVFTEENVMKILFAHVNTKPEPPSKYSKYKIPTKLEDIIMQCLEKKADNRPQTINDLMNMLSEINFKIPWDLKKAEIWWKNNVEIISMK